jgi:hypothetical protein
VDQSGADDGSGGDSGFGKGPGSGESRGSAADCGPVGDNDPAEGSDPVEGSDPAAGWGSVRGVNGRRTRKPHFSQNWSEFGFPHHGHASSGLPAGRVPPAWCLPTTRTGLEAVRVPQTSQKSSVTES